MHYFTFVLGISLSLKEIIFQIWHELYWEFGNVGHSLEMSDIEKRESFSFMNEGLGFSVGLATLRQNSL